MHILQPLPIAALVLSLTFAYYDWKTLEVPLWLLLTALAIGLGVCFCCNREFISVVYALIPGVLMLVLSLATGGNMGIGDGAFVCSMAFLLEWKQVCVVVGTAFLAAAVVSLGMIVASQLRGSCVRGRKLPFLCFMPMGMLLLLFKGC